MSKKLEIGIATISVVIALIILFFGDNIYQQKTGRSAYENTQQAIQAIPRTPVFSADFENGSIDNFTVDSGNWSIGIDETGGKVLESNTPTNSVSSILFGSSDLNNFIVEYRFKSMGTSTQDNSGCSLQFRKTPETNYVFFLNLLSTQSVISFSYVENSGWDWQYLVGESISLKSDTWYSVKLVSDDEESKAYIDDVLRLTVSDSRLKNGNLALSVDNAAFCKFDDIQVWSLP